MSYAEDELLPISALQHLLFCERQCALIHVERVWAENRLTAEGRVMHQRVHDAGTTVRAGVRCLRGLPLRSLRLGLAGIADVVELEPWPDAPAGAGVARDGGCWRPFPVEYKRGRPKHGRWDEVQLCAQALCLEEMLGTSLPAGALYYGETHQRHAVDLDGALRAEVERAATRLHELVDAGVTPPPRLGEWCKACSLVNVCLPRTVAGGRSVQEYLASAGT